MNIDRIFLNDIPLLIASGSRTNLKRKAGTVLMFHGLTSSKEKLLPELERLCQSGFLAVGIDNAMHGDRMINDHDNRFSTDNPKIADNFTEAIRLTAREIPFIINCLVEMGLACEDRIGITGVSMGGFIAYGAVIEEPRIKACAPIIGSPLWPGKDYPSPHRFPDRFFPVALLSQTAGADTTVPPLYARQLHEKLQHFYKNEPEKLAYIEYDGIEHIMPPDVWEKVWSRVISWFTKYL